jgi:5-methylcytosine-specific restriction endonuclease McrA
MAKENTRPDHDGAHRLAFERNKKKILATQTICGICGKPVDKNLAYPHPMSATVDHIIPINRGGHPSDIDNLQLAHFICNRQKSDKFVMNHPEMAENTNRDLPKLIDWERVGSE